MSRSVLSFVLIFFAGLSNTHAAERFAGEWTINSSKLEVIVKSWGENCGPRPKSYSNFKKREVIIIVRGEHLIFSRGGVRTDRCWSPNPRIRTINANVTTSRWSRHCRTTPDDPRYEDGEYSLVAKGDDRLNYFSVSKVDWRLKGDHCVAYLEERRVYVRAPPETDGEAGDESSGKADNRCEEPGPLKRIVLKPRRAQIGPGQKICFKAVGIDEKSCRFPVEAVLSVTQDQKEVPGLLSKGGCFLAGETAADSEGLYVITARVDGKRSTSQVKVNFPDLSDLLSAELKPSEEAVDDQGPEETAPGEIGTDLRDASVGDAGTPLPVEAVSPPAVKAPPSPRSPVPVPSEPGWMQPSPLVIALIGLGLAVVVLVIVLLVKRRNSFEFDDEDDWDDDPYVTPAQTSSRLVAASDPSPPDDDPKLYCPSCLRAFPLESAFCPFHGEKLVTKKLANMEHGGGDGTQSTTGMICPTCHRGYGFDARYCPHDARELVPYQEWRKKNVSIVIK
jgi:hypothetical protein